MNTASSAVSRTAPSSAYHKARYQLAIALTDIGAVLTKDSDHPLVVERNGPNGKERGFKLKLHEKNPDAPLSPFYLNLRTADNKSGPLTKELVDLSASCMHMLAIGEGLAFDAVVGVPRAGDPFAEALARFSGKSLIVLDKYEHGGKRSIASPKGKIPTSVKKAVLVDDLITKADSKIEGVRVMQDENITVDDVVVLVDREQGGYDQLMEWGCHLHSVFTISELLDFYVAEEKMSPQLRDEIQNYLAKT
jgi:uridine monophosphate synthetase